MDDAKGEEGQSRLGSTKRNFEVWSGHRPMGLGDGKRSDCQKWHQVELGNDLLML